MLKILLISNKNDITTDLVVQKLQQSGVKFYRFNTEELTHSVHIHLDFEKEIFQLYDSNVKQIIDLKEIVSVYYRRPEIPTIHFSLSHNETKFVSNELTYTLEGVYKILRNAFWLSPLYSIRETENKIYQISLAKEIGLNIPNCIITNKPFEANHFFERNYKDCIMLPIKSGVAGDLNNMKVIFTNAIPLGTNFNMIQTCPTYFQSNIRKKADVRVVIVGNDFFSAQINSHDTLETQINRSQSTNVLKYSKIDIPVELKNKCRMLMQRLNLQGGALDFIETENGEFFFLEINPNGQWAKIEQQLNYNISGSIVKLLVNGSNM